MIVQDLKIWLEMEVPVIEDGNSFGQPWCDDIAIMLTIFL